MAAAPTSIPAGTRGLGPILGIRTMVDTFAATAMPPMIGKNAKPVTIGV